MKSVERMLVLLFLGPALSACGANASSSDGGTCPTFNPCGGDVVGTWHFKSTCTESTPKDAAAACTVQSSRPPGTGSEHNATYTFGANGTLTEAVSDSPTRTSLQYPGAGCAHSDASPDEYCAHLQQVISDAITGSADAGMNMAPITSIGLHCTASGNDVCKCDEDVTYSPYTVEGTYTTSGDTITIVFTASSLPGLAGADAGTGIPLAYCVSGNTLTLGPTAGSSDRSVLVLGR
jgi:hypothetical protein